MFQISRFVTRDILLCVTIASSRYEDSCIDNETTKIFECLSEAWDNVVVWPYIGTQIFREILG
jgi:hypothetical protein